MLMAIHPPPKSIVSSNPPTPFQAIMSYTST
jgi:hypothetical protein